MHIVRTYIFIYIFIYNIRINNVFIVYRGRQRPSLYFSTCSYDTLPVAYTLGTQNERIIARDTYSLANFTYTYVHTYTQPQNIINVKRKNYRGTYVYVVHVYVNVVARTSNYSRD